jgi:hypothetical protein
VTWYSVYEGWDITLRQQSLKRKRVTDMEYIPWMISQIPYLEFKPLDKREKAAQSKETFAEILRREIKNASTRTDR